MKKDQAVAIARGATASQTQKKDHDSFGCRCGHLSRCGDRGVRSGAAWAFTGAGRAGQQSEGFPYSINSNLVRDMRMLGPDVLLLTDEAVTVLDSSGREVSRMAACL